MISRRKKLIIFDLDGTLVNTIADLASSTNFSLRKMGMPTHEVDNYYHFLGNGIEKLLERATPVSERTTENLQTIKEIFVAHYSTHCVDNASTYPQIHSLLQTLVAKG